MRNEVAAASHAHTGDGAAMEGSKVASARHGTWSNAAVHYSATTRTSARHGNTCGGSGAQRNGQSSAGRGAANWLHRGDMYGLQGGSNWRDGHLSRGIRQHSWRGGPRQQHDGGLG